MSKISFVARRSLPLLLVALCLSANAAEVAKKKQKPKGKKDTNAPAIYPASDEGELAIKKFKVAPGLKVELFAAEPMLANPVTFAIDEKGRIYVAETFRHTDGVLDIRHHMNWLDEEIASKSVEEHLAMLKKYAAETPNMTEYAERISLIEDTNGDGKADKSTVFASSFTNILDGVGAGLLARKGDVYYTCIPDLYLLRDKDGDGVADETKSLQTGYGVRTAFLGHDLHGLRFGPDGKLYFSSGDRGFSVKQNGMTVDSPETGAILRCDPDGGNLEIFATGLRNPQELVFDQYGNLWTGDNNSDAGDQARWVYLVEGGDSGWRVGWQFLNAPYARGPWNSERMWDPAFATNVAYILPPITNIASGPSGITYYPGIGWPENYRNRFFLVDFRGSQANSLIHTFKVKPHGASFELTDREELISGVLSTDVDFGPDGAIYISDWVNGWAKPGKGRIYKITPTNSFDTELVAEAKKLIGEGMEKRPLRELAKLLAHPDQRVRQEAQFALADKGDLISLTQVAKESTNQLARINAIWGLGQVSKSQKYVLKQIQALDAVNNLLSDSDPEVIAQAAKILGEAKFEKAYDRLAVLVGDSKNPRTQFFVAMALGKLGDSRGIKPILDMLRASNDQDIYLRHAGVMALAWLNDSAALAEAAKSDSPAVRMASLLALRRAKKPELAMFLNDPQSSIVKEAARAINDLPITNDLPALAKMIAQPHEDITFSRRVLNANFRVGTAECAAALATLASQKETPEALRVEALEMLAEWKAPAGRDRISGLWRPVPPRDGNIAVEAIKPFLTDLLQTAPVAVQIAAVKAADQLGIPEASPILFAVVSDKKADATVRVEALKILGKRHDEKLSEVVAIAAADENENLRKEALTLQSQLKPAQANNALAGVLETGSVGEKQNALTTLGGLAGDEADVILDQWLDKLIAGNVPAELQLDLLEAAAQRSSAGIKEKLQKYNDARSKDDDLANFRECLAGGDAEAGKKVFFERVEASCVRCHKIGTEGGEVGPNLSGIGTKKTRKYLLNSIVNPNKEIAVGFESLLVTLKNGTAYAGIMKSEDAKELVLNSPEDGIVKVAKKEIQTRERGLSGMLPELAQVLSKQDLRNLVEFLASQK